MTTMQHGRLAGKTAGVTGGTTVIDFETARQNLAHGARVIVTGRDQACLDSANAAVFLDRDRSSYITGADLTVDGGYMNV